MRGFIIESGAIVPVEVTVADVTTQCRNASHDGQSDCWHSRYEDVFRDLCLPCGTPCRAYLEKNRPAFGKLVELKKLNPGDAIRFKQRIAATGNDLRKVYEKIPSVDCSNCGDCCSIHSIDLHSVEYLHILNFIKTKFSPADFKKIRGLCRMEMAIEASGMKNMRRCPFRDEKQKICTINEVKPLVCRHYTCENIEGADSVACEARGEFHEVISSFSAPFFIVRCNEILIFKINELKRWFLNENSCDRKV